MNIGLLIAGGSGNRMGQDIPKQFMHVDGAPVIVWTMKAFQQHPDIDGIAVVCLKGWDTVLQSYANQFSIDKLKWIFPGGDTGFESIHNGIYGLKDAGCDDEDLVLIHDGVRPLLSQEIISSNIATCKAYGYAITGIQCREAILESEDGFTTNKSIPRDTLIRTQTPQTFSLKNITLGYTIPKKITSKWGIENLRVYIVGDNIWLKSNRRGLDPRQSISGATSSVYSALSSYSFGINLSF